MNCLLQFRGSMFSNKTVFRGSAVVSAMAALSVLSCAGTSYAEAAPEKPSSSKTSSTKTTATPAKKAAPKKLYSAERSLTRQAKLARARAAVMAREMAAAQPHYKLDASGDLVPDVRAAAAIIYD